MASPPAHPPFDRERLAQQVQGAPFHRWLGLRLDDAGPDGVTIVMPWREEMVSDPRRRYTHGGILATLIDIAADYAIAARIGRGVPTVDMRVDFHRAAFEGELRARGTVIKLGATLSTAAAEIRDAEGRLIASGRGVYFTAELRSSSDSKSEAG